MAVLIVEDDGVTADAMAEACRELEQTPVHAKEFNACLAAVDEQSYDLIVLDRMLPGGDGLDAISKLRLRGASCPILVVSALGRSSNRVEGLDRGADDYLAKPFDPMELQARMRALLRRSGIQEDHNDLVQFGDIDIKLKARTVHRSGQHIPLSPKEFVLLSYLADHANEVVTRKMLLENVWKLNFDPQTNVVDVHVGRLRRKLEPSGLPPVLHTIRGEGYLFSADPVGT